jgi:hypothetical protein
MTTPEPTVRCSPRGDGWRCTVTVGTDVGATEHEVDLGRSVLEDLAPGRTAEELVGASFVFLLEREPRESILRSFELPIIGRYFPDYPREIRRRLGRA